MLVASISASRAFCWIMHEGSEPQGQATSATLVCVHTSPGAEDHHMRIDTWLVGSHHDMEF